MQVYESPKVGKLLAWGGDHIVYAYGEDHIIKFSILEFLLGQAGQKKSVDDYAVCLKFFGQWVLETQFFRSPRGRFLAKVQLKISGRPLRKSDLEDPLVCDQFRVLMSGYRELVKKGHPEIDLIGREGAFSGALSNIFITGEKKLVIFDTTLLHISTPVMGLVMRLFRVAFLALQEARLKSFARYASLLLASSHSSPGSWPGDEWDTKTEPRRRHP